MLHWFVRNRTGYLYKMDLVLYDLQKLYAIKRKQPTIEHKRYLRLFSDYFAWIEHQFLSGIRDSSKAESLGGMMRGVGGVRK